MHHGEREHWDEHGGTIAGASVHVPYGWYAAGMSSPREQIRLKLSRAEKHLGDLDAAIRLFCESKPYVLVSKPHPVTEIDHIRLIAESVQPIPSEIGLIIGDTVHNLRSALDHLIHQLVLANGETASRDTEFPIIDPAKQYKTAIHGRKIQGIAPAAKDLIRKIQPSKTGDKTLWNLHCLDIADKHRLLITVQQRLENWSAGAYVFDTYPLPLVEGESVINIPRSTYERQPHENYQIAINIAFSETEIAANETVIPYLRNSTDVVSDTISVFDSLF